MAFQTSVLRRVSPLPAVALAMTVGGCSGQPAVAQRAERAVATASPAPDVGSAVSAEDAQTENVALLWAECPPYAAAVFKRLSAVENGRHASPAIKRDLSKLASGCEQGDAAICNGLGVVYAEGHGVQPDVTKGVGYFRGACDAGLPIGCLNLAVLHSAGQGVTKDLTAAAQFLEKACVLGNAIACENLAVDYASGRGVPKDFSKAATFYEKACDAGWSPGCTNLAGLYLVGSGVAKDLATAKSYYEKACGMGSENACEVVKRGLSGGGEE